MPIRLLGLALAILALSLRGGLTAQAPTAESVLAAARAALGGEQRLTAVTSFVASGRTRQVRGDNLVPIEFEISVELPDKYVRRDEIPAQESGPTSIGFNGDGLIQLPAPPAPVNPAQAQNAGRGRVMAAKQDFARLALGLFASSFSSFPLTFKYVAEAEAPQGAADVIEATGPPGPPNFAARLFVYKDTHLPVMLSWQGMAQGKPVEFRLFYADYRDVGGLKWPFRLRRAAGAETTEETTFDRFRINARIDPRKFEVRK
jgi:hypothetical protein